MTAQIPPKWVQNHMFYDIFNTFSPPGCLQNLRNTGFFTCFDHLLRSRFWLQSYRGRFGFRAFPRGGGHPGKQKCYAPYVGRVCLCTSGCTLRFGIALRFLPLQPAISMPFPRLQLSWSIVDCSMVRFSLSRKLATTIYVCVAPSHRGQMQTGTARTLETLRCTATTGFHRRVASLSFGIAEDDPMFVYDFVWTGLSGPIALPALRRCCR